ncbi:MAG TPA: hypothetical protein VEC14_09640, partial [Reyranellaceae bacterium]|nr:hypothetical protein [Reyranellaceae bacterium]
MSFGFLDLYTQKVSLGSGADADTIAAAQVSAPLDVAGFDKMASLGYRSARAEMFDYVDKRQYEMWEDALDQLRKRTGKTLRNPISLRGPQDPQVDMSGWSAAITKWVQDADPAFRRARTAITDDAQAEFTKARETFPDLPDPSTFRQRAIDEIKQRRADLRAAQVGSTGLGDVGEFFGQVGADFQHPLNILTLPFGAPAALYTPVKTGIMAGVMRVLGVGAVEGSIAAGTQLAIETEKVPRLQGYGVRYDWDEAWGNVVGAAGAGFILGSGFRALVAGWRAARGSGPGSSAPYHPDIGSADDGARVAERLLLDQESPLPPRASDAHAAALDEARAAVAEGRTPATAPVVERGLADVRAEGEELLARARRTADAPSMRAEAPSIEPSAIKKPPVAVFTPAGRRVEVGYEVVDIRTLIPSHTDDFHPNAAFPATLQPRDRARAANRMQVAEIAATLAPERLGPSPDATTGAPIVAVDNVVESGNGRVLALRKAMAEGGDTAKAYRAWLEKQGFDTSGIEYPVLVARRQTPLDPAEREAFVREANAAAAARMAVSEQAASDARLITPIVDLYRGGEVTFAQNADFVRAFLKGIPASERGALWTDKGGLSQEGARRVQAAILHAAYGDPALVAKLMEAPSNDIKAIGGALMDVAPEWAKMRERARKGEIAPDVDRTADLMGAVRLIEDARQKGVLVSDLLDQGGLFESPEPTRLFVGMMYNDPALKQAAGRAAVGQRLRG